MENNGEENVYPGNHGDLREQVRPKRTPELLILLAVNQQIHANSIFWCTVNNILVYNKCLKGLPYC